MPGKNIGVSIRTGKLSGEESSRQRSGNTYEEILTLVLARSKTLSIEFLSWKKLLKRKKDRTKKTLSRTSHNGMHGNPAGAIVLQ